MNFKRIKMMGLATLMMATVVGGTSAYAGEEGRVGINYFNDEENNIQSIEAVENQEGVVEAALSTDVAATIPQKNRFTLYVPTTIAFEDIQIGDNTKDYVVSVKDDAERPVVGKKFVKLEAESDDKLSDIANEANTETIDYTCDKNGNKLRSISGRDLYFSSGDQKKKDWDFRAFTNITEEKYVDLDGGTYSDEVIFRATVVDSDPTAASNDPAAQED